MPYVCIIDNDRISQEPIDQDWEQKTLNENELESKEMTSETERVIRVKKTHKKFHHQQMSAIKENTIKEEEGGLPWWRSGWESAC